MLNPIVYLIHQLITLYTFVLILDVVISWLVSLNILNRNQPFVFKLSYALHRLTEPALQPIRKALPDFGGFDISPIILLIGLQFLDYTLIYYFRMVP